MKYDLSILIPARNEMFLARTVKDILEHSEAKTEVIVVLDGAWADPVIQDDNRVTIIYHSESIGQRAATNEAAKLSDAKYVLKCDAHCSFDQGFDRKLLEAIAGHDDWTMVPIMRNLHAFDWVCPDGHRRYQGPSGPCLECKKETKRDIVWIAKQSPQSKSYCFDSEPHFQYFGEWCKRPEYAKDLAETGLTDTMSLQGSCFMMTREKYWELKICDEEFGSWGSQGIEVALKTKLSGGRVVVNHKTWYAHMFRTQGGDFGFPYNQSGRQVDRAKKMAREVFFNNRWSGQIYPLSSVVEMFWPIKGWSEKDRQLVTDAGVEFYRTKGVGKPIKEPTVEKGIIYYTDNRLKVKLAHAVQDQLKKMNLPIVSASLKPMSNFGQNIHLKLERGYLTMFKQILVALESSNAEVVYFCEHDCLYPVQHFEFTPVRKDTFYYNINVVKVDVNTGKTLKVDVCQQVSGICVFRESAIVHYRERVDYIEKNGYNRNTGFEPGTKRIDWGTQFRAENWSSPVPLLDIRHSKNLTPNRWRKELFRNQVNTEGWAEGNINEVIGWDAKVLNKLIGL